MNILKNSTLSRILLNPRGSCLVVRQLPNQSLLNNNLFPRNLSVALNASSFLIPQKPKSNSLQYYLFNSSTPSSQSQWRNLIDRNFHLSSSIKMAPPGDQRPDTPAAKIDELIKTNAVMIFSKTYCPFCTKVKALFTDLGITFHAFELDIIDQDEAAAIQNALKEKTGQATVPNVFINEKHIGGCDDTFKTHQRVGLLSLVKPQEGMEVEDAATSYDYDLVVIGGGSGGLAASKEAAKLGKKVAVCDFVKPTPIGTTWGLGGTCVNVGCIPKKLMHQAALLGTACKDASSFGWKLPEEKSHDWGQMVEGIQNYISSLNWGYRVALRDAKVTYLNEYAQFLDSHTLKTVGKKGKEQTITSKDFIIAVGGRPKYPEFTGSKEFCITSDDLFSLPYNPGKTLCIGASYIALECAGFLAGLGIETEVMVRSILLRGFDQQVAELIGEHMESHGVRFHRGWIPVSVKKIEDSTPPKLLVTAKETNGDKTVELEVNTVVLAVGREACTKDLNLDSAQVKISSSSGKVFTNERDQSNVSNIYAIGDVAEGRPELTPVAIQAGVLLARRLYKNSNVLTDYGNVPTTVFTPLEYGCVGLSEEDAIKKYKPEGVEIYHSHFQPLEFTVPKRDENKCYAKLICAKSENEKIVGFHYLGPNAGEITQGFALGIRMGATKDDFDSLIGIHPTSAEIFTTMEITKASGKSALKTGC